VNLRVPSNHNSPALHTDGLCGELRKIALGVLAALVLLAVRGVASGAGSVNIVTSAESVGGSPKQQMSLKLEGGGREQRIELEVDRVNLPPPGETNGGVCGTMVKSFNIIMAEARGLYRDLMNSMPGRLETAASGRLRRPHGFSAAG
jgi:hypothetical protein